LQAGPGRVRNEIYAEMLDGHIVVKGECVRFGNAVGFRSAGEHTDHWKVPIA
jgi:hypothetical protein